MKREQVGKWVLSLLLWMWTGGLYFFMEVAWKTFQGRPETISWTMFALAIFLAVPLEVQATSYFAASVRIFSFSYIDIDS